MSRARVQPPPALEPPARDAVAARRAERDDAELARRRARNRRLGRFFVLLAILAAIAAVGVVLLQRESGGPQVGPVDRGDVQSQVEGINRFLDRYTR